MKALILVDIQNDFLPGGALAVPEGDRVVPIANALLTHLSGLRVVATRDYHPAHHGSFASQHPGKAPYETIDLNGLPQVLWPDHCVEGTVGSEFAPGLLTARIDRVFVKGTDPTVDSYSGFFDNGRRKATGLGKWLETEGLTELLVLGLATDYCVKFTALDARSLGLTTTLVLDGCRGVNLAPGDSLSALRELEAAGVRLVQSRELLGAD